MAFRALFFGTPAFAVPCLSALSEIAEVVGVVCQPDKPVGRHQKLTAPPVKLWAEEHRMPVVQPTKLRTGEFGAWVKAQHADVALVVAYGRILPTDVLDGPRLGCVNVHASLLPRLRGAAPIQWAIVHGETETGVTLMVLDEGLDTGAMLEQFPTPIGVDETAGELTERLALIGAEAVRSGIPRYVAGGYALHAQDTALATHAPPLTRDDGRLDFSLSAPVVHARVRGMNPWPGAFTAHHGKLVKVHGTRLTKAARSGKPGEVVFADKAHLVVACGEAALEFVTVQLEGKKPMRGVDWVMGRGIAEGDVLASMPGTP